MMMFLKALGIVLVLAVVLFLSFVVWAVWALRKLEQDAYNDKG